MSGSQQTSSFGTRPGAPEGVAGAGEGRGRQQSGSLEEGSLEDELNQSFNRPSLPPRQRTGAQRKGSVDSEASGVGSRLGCALLVIACFLGGGGQMSHNWGTTL